MSVLRDTFKEPMFLWTLAFVAVMVVVVTILQGGFLSSFGLEIKETITVPPKDKVLYPNVDYMARLYTEYGQITIDLLERAAPENVASFVYLAKKGYYDSNYWHRIVTNVLIQTGKSNKYRVENNPPLEIVKNMHFSAGTVGVANLNSSKNSHQFFIVASGASRDILKKWDGKYTIIGKVVKGQDVVDKIASIKASKSGKPSKKVKLTRVEIVETPLSER